MRVLVPVPSGMVAPSPHLLDPSGDAGQREDPQQDRHEGDGELHPEPHTRRDDETEDHAIAPPTATIVSVCPSPQSAPIHAAARNERCRLTIVVTAMT
jgi:hypothetical protein